MTEKPTIKEGIQEGHTLNRQRLNIQAGDFVSVDEKSYQIKDILDFENATGIDVESGRVCQLPISQMQRITNATAGIQAVASQDINGIAHRSWKTAQERYEAIRPLINDGGVPKSVVQERAKEINVGTATLYRWIRRYKDYPATTSLIPQQPGYKKGKNRLPKEIEEIIVSVIEDTYLTKERPTQQATHREVCRRCHLKNIQPPSNYTVRARIAELSEQIVLKKRGYAKRAKQKFMPVVGSFPDATHPLAVVQIDHTPSDIILVDDEFRKPIGRPYITIAIDVYSRMIVGYYLSFDAPSSTSVAMCVTHAILPKNAWLTRIGVNAKWDVWGFMDKIHTDNGSDFRCETFQKACQTYGINLEYRPHGQPQFGGHVERAFGTLLKEIHDLPGTTFSNIKERDEYKSEKHAAFTLAEFEKWLVTFICTVYHERIHSSIGMTPAKKWEIGIFGDSKTPAHGLPKRAVDEKTLWLDFLPSYSRTIQNYGVEIEGLFYFDDILRKWINLPNPYDPSGKNKFTFRVDPRDISKAWFYEPELKQYFEISLADRVLPAMSLWEYKQVKTAARKEGMKSVNVPQLMNALTDLRQQTEEAKERTKSARLKQQKSKIHAKKITPVTVQQEAQAEPVAVPLTSNHLVDDDDIQAFEELE